LTRSLYPVQSPETQLTEISELNITGDRRLQVLAFIIRAISALNRVIGEVLCWLALACVLLCFTVVVQRYFFNTSTLWLQDLYVWVSGAMFTGVAGFALLRDDHVRVDIFYRPASIRRKAIADLFGVLVFLLPFMFIVIYYGLPAVRRSWSYFEASGNVGGMPGLYILKSFILVFAVLVGLQGLAMALRSILVLTNNEHLLPTNLRYGANDAKEAH
jgi:TRAP-type mannitol/chloroaromatic compound transport system permease small subunit